MHLIGYTTTSNVMLLLFLPVWISCKNLWMGRHKRRQPWVPSKTSRLKGNKSSAMRDFTEYNLRVDWSFGTGLLCRNCFFPHLKNFLSSHEIFCCRMKLQTKVFSAVQAFRHGTFK